MGEAEREAGDAPTSASIFPALSSEISVLTEPSVPLHFQLPPTMNCVQPPQPAV
jgi:hypothetical protein